MLTPGTLRRLRTRGSNLLAAFTWRCVDNLGPSLAYRLSSQRPSGEAARVLSELNRNGIAISSVSRLLGDVSCYTELRVTLQQLEEDSADEIARARERSLKSDDWKSYVFKLLGERPILDPQSVYVRFALQPPILQIANSYFGMRTRLRFYNAWHNFATNGPARDSQLWHRDPEDRFILKVFVYLSDVCDGAGPFYYASGSHGKGNLRRLPAGVSQRGARRSSDAEMGLVVPPDSWVKAVGPEGTVIFADTRGFHKGGFARSKERILYNCMFTSQATKWPECFDRKPTDSPASLGAEQAFALGNQASLASLFKRR